jgi:HlyD family secretion protein
MDPKSDASGYGFSQPAARNTVAPPQQVVSRPTPLPKRPKGRWFLGALLLASCGYGLWQAYEAFFHYRAYGVVSGRLLQLSPPWEGELTAFHVREGDSVRQGQPLLTMDNAQMRQKLCALSDELVSAQADLEAEAAKLKWQAAFHLDQSNGAQARYHEMWGSYLQEQKTLEKLREEVRIGEQLFDKRAIAPFELKRSQQDLWGQQLKVDKLAVALDEAKKYAQVGTILLARLGDLGDSLAEDGEDQLKPKLAKIEALKAERSRLEQYLAKGRLVAPSNGLVVKLHRFAGEHARLGDTLVSFLEEGSLHVVAFVAQSESESFPPGQVVDLVVSPNTERLEGKIVRLGAQMEAAPEQIKRHYPAGQRLLPVYIEPCPQSQRWMALRIESVVKLP